MDYNRFLKSLTGFAARVSGITLIRRMIFLRRRAVILCYHDPSPDVLRAHLTYLTRRYNIIALDTLCTALISRTWNTLPDRSLVLTLDDGHKGNYALHSVLREFKVPATVFACSHIVNTRRRYWFRCGYPERQTLKTLSNQERLFVLKVKAGFEQEAEYPEPQALSRREMADMQPEVDIQSHSRFHPVLTTCADSECRDEVTESKTFLENMLHKDVRYFAYPNGSFGRREEDFVRQAGYAAAVGMDPGTNGPESNLYALKRTGVSDTASVNELAAELSGVLTFIRNLMR